MKKIKLVTVLGLIVGLVVTLIILPACKEEAAAPEVVVETVIETVTETVTDTVEVVTESPFTYEKLREMADARQYEGEPASGHTLGFANLLKAFPFCTQVEDGIIEEWQLAGGSMDDLTVLDNAFDTNLSIQNADIIFGKNVEVFVEFQVDAKTNAMIAKKAELLGIFMMGVDIPVPGFPFMGVDNFNAGILAGEWAADKVEEVFGGWENVDLVLYFWSPPIGEVVGQRTLASIIPLTEAFGDEADPDIEGSKGVLVDAGGGGPEEAQEATTGILAKYPDAENIVIFSVSDDATAAIQAGAELSGRWDADKWLVSSQGYVGELAGNLIRTDIIDGSVAYFPENYSRYIIPGAVAYMYGNPVPPYLYVDNVMVTKDNIDEYYPE